MKIRNGFVSNSSSSSYMVDIDVGFDQFAKTVLAEYSWSFFSLKEIRKFYEERLRWADRERMSLCEDLKTATEHKEFFQRSVERINNKIEGFQGMLSKLVEGNDYVGSPEMITEYLWKKGIMIGEKYDGKKTSFICSTSMHNDFMEGLPDIAKEIILYYMFDTDIQVKCLRDGDD